MATASQSCIVRLWKDPSSIGEQVAEQVVERIERMGGSLNDESPVT